ncbi:MAG: putative nucleotidyltransferase [Actinomycetia bacterium]|nr:putative nucleotidyltransferase [Actinomycetes bacterium]
MSSPRVLALRVASFGLPGAPPMINDIPLGENEWGPLRDEVARTRITGHFVAALEAGAFASTDAQRAEAMRSHERALALDLVLERLLVHAGRRFDAAAIEYRALKGTALSHTVYSRPELRSYGDIDLLVRGKQYDDALALLVEAGGRPHFGEPRPGFTRLFGKGVCVAMNALEIDVHRSFVAGPFGLSIDTDDLFANPIAVPLAGTEVPALPAVPRFLHACYHAALGDRVARPVALRDVAQILTTTHLEHDEVMATARRWRGEIVVQRAVLLAWLGLGLTAENPLLRAVLAAHPKGSERRALQAYVGTGHSYATQAAAGIWALPGVRARAAYASALLLPNREYARERDGYLARWRRAGALVRDGRPVR